MSIGDFTPAALQIPWCYSGSYNTLQDPVSIVCGAVIRLAQYSVVSHIFYYKNGSYLLK